MNLKNHPAVFTDSVLDAIRIVISKEARNKNKVITILDPFAGIGKVHKLAGHIAETFGVELEPEWANQHKRNIVGDATALPFSTSRFGAIVTSPCYANRMADNFHARDSSERRTYRTFLGRSPSDNSAAAMQWGPEYKSLHKQAIDEMYRVVESSGLICVNMKNHIRKGKEQKVVEWWIERLLLIDCTLVEVVRIPTPGYRYGANNKARINGEVLIVVRKT